MSAREVAPKAKPGMICDIREIVEKPEVCWFRGSMPSILARFFQASKRLARQSMSG